MIKNKSNYSEHSFKNLEMVQIHLESVSFQGCTFEHCRFTETIFKNCQFVNCTFKHCDLSLIQIPNSSLSGAEFVDSKIIGVNWTQALWPDKRIWDPVEFTKCALSHSTFLGINLSGLKMRRCEAVNVDFREADLSKADFAFTDLKDSLFLATNLAEADLGYARNYQIDPSQNNIRKAKFSLPEALGLLYSMDIQINDS